MSSNYWIGTSAANTAPIDALFAVKTDSQPNAEPMQYAETVNRFDFTRQERGILSQPWHWDGLSETLRNRLYALRNTTVYVRTIDNSGAFGYYSAVLVWPEQEPIHTATTVLDLTVELRNLQPFTYEVP